MNVTTVRAKIVVAFAAVILLLIGFGGFAYQQLHTIESQAIALRAESVPGLQIAGRLESVSISTYTSVQRLIAERDPIKMQEIQGALEEQTSTRLELLRQYQSIIKRDKQRELYESTKAALAPYMLIRRQVEKLGANPGTKADADRLLHEQLESLYGKLQESISDEVNYNKANADEAAQGIQDSVLRSEVAILISLVVGVVLATVAGSLLVQAINRPLGRLMGAIERLRTGDFSEKLNSTQGGEFGVLADGLNRVTDSLQDMAAKARQVADGNLAIEVKRLSEEDILGNSLAQMVEKLSALIRRVQKSGLQLNTSATEIAATAQEQLSTASQISATTAEIGATSKEISTTSRELAHTVKEIAEVAEKTAELAGSGQSGLSRMKATMEQVREASAVINARLGSLSEKAGNIGTVVTTITRVADQTNLLSLNAAIEAEKAGDYGRGFGVVAAEIRRLADQTALATGDIEQMIKEIQSAVAAGVMGMDKFSEEVRRGGEVVHQVSEELSQIIQHVQALTPDFETVSEGMQSQAQGAQQISDALGHLGESSKQTVDSLRQSNLAIEQLNEAARGLQDGVARFTLKA